MTASGAILVREAARARRSRGRERPIVESPLSSGTSATASPIAWSVEASSGKRARASASLSTKIGACWGAATVAASLWRNPSGADGAKPSWTTRRGAPVASPTSIAPADGSQRGDSPLQDGARDLVAGRGLRQSCGRFLEERDSCGGSLGCQPCGLDRGGGSLPRGQLCPFRRDACLCRTSRHVELVEQPGRQEHERRSGDHARDDEQRGGDAVGEQAARLGDEEPEAENDWDHERCRDEHPGHSSACCSLQEEADDAPGGLQEQDSCRDGEHGHHAGDAHGAQVGDAERAGDREGVAEQRRERDHRRGDRARLLRLDKACSRKQQRNGEQDDGGRRLG